MPSYALNIFFLLSATWLSERFKKRSLLASFQVFCASRSSRYALTGRHDPAADRAHLFQRADLALGQMCERYAGGHADTADVVTMLIVGHPYSHAIQVAWVSRNANSVGDRTVNSAVYNSALPLIGRPLTAQCSCRLVRVS